MVILLMSPDLMLRSQLESATRRTDYQFRQVDGLATLKAALDDAQIAIVLFDVSAGADPSEVVEAVRSSVPVPRIVAFGPHVHQDRLKQAEEAGCDQVISRGQLVRMFPDF